MRVFCIRLCWFITFCTLSARLLQLVACLCIRFLLLLLEFASLKYQGSLMYDQSVQFMLQLVRAFRIEFSVTFSCSLCLHILHAPQPDDETITRTVRGACEPAEHSLRH